MRRRREIELLNTDRSWPLVNLASPTGLRVVWARLHNRVFMLLAEWGPRLAAAWIVVGQPRKRRRGAG